MKIIALHAMVYVIDLAYNPLSMPAAAKRIEQGDFQYEMKDAKGRLVAGRHKEGLLLADTKKGAQITILYRDNGWLSGTMITDWD